VTSALRRWRARKAYNRPEKITARYTNAARIRVIAVRICLPGLGLISNCYRMDPAMGGR